MLPTMGSLGRMAMVAAANNFRIPTYMKFHFRQFTEGMALNPWFGMEKRPRDRGIAVSGLGSVQWTPYLVDREGSESKSQIQTHFPTTSHYQAETGLSLLVHANRK